MDTNLLPEYIPFLLWYISIVSVFITINSIQTYRKKYKEIKSLFNRYIECNAIVITPVILNGKSKVPEISDIFQNIYNLPLEYVYTEVSFMAESENIQTIIIRQSFGKNPKFNDIIKIYYDPYNPEQAFAKDMKSILLHKPLRDCIIYGFVSVVCLLSAIII